MQPKAEQRFLQAAVTITAACFLYLALGEAPRSEIDRFSSTPLRSAVHRDASDAGDDEIVFVLSEAESPKALVARTQDSLDDARGSRLILRLEEEGSSLVSLAALAIFDDWDLLESVDLQPGTDFELGIPWDRDLLVAIQQGALPDGISLPDRPDRLSILRGEYSVIGSVRLAAGETREMTVRLAQTATVEISLSDEDGAPLAGAPLVLQRVDLAARPRRALSGPDGRATFESIHRGEYRVIAPRHAMGESVLPVRVLRVGPGEWHSTALRLESAGASVAGSISSQDGAPASGIRVELRRHEARIGSTRTGDDGTFRFEGVPHGALTLFVPEQDTAAPDGRTTFHLLGPAYRVDLETYTDHELDLGQLDVFPVRRRSILIHLEGEHGTRSNQQPLIALLSSPLDAGSALPEAQRRARRAVKVQLGDALTIERPLHGHAEQISLWRGGVRVSELCLSASSPEELVLFVPGR